jgi:hypothetical protein
VLRFPRPTYSNVVATLALFFALSGTALAGAHVLITGADVKDRSLTGADLANHSVGLLKLTRGTAAQLRGARGPVGPAGTSGQAGQDGTPGAPGGTGPAGTQIKLAGYGTSVDQTLPDDSALHTIWSTQFTATANEAFIMTGQIGGASSSGCPDGDPSFTEQLTLDGAPYSPSGALSTFSPGPHTLAYQVQNTCSVSGSPVHVPAQDAVVIPFTLP